MPNSKKPRHKKKRSAHNVLTKYNGMAKIRNMMLITDRDQTVRQCIKSMFELNTIKIQDIDSVIFKRIIAFLVIGKVLGNKLLADEDRENCNRTIEQSAYMLYTTVRLKSRGAEVPQSNLEVIRDGLSLSQELFLFAQDNDGDAFLNAIYASMGNENDGIEQHKLRHKYLLGDRWDQIYQWVENNELTFSDDPDLVSEESETANQEGVNHG